MHLTGQFASCSVLLFLLELCKAAEYSIIGALINLAFSRLAFWWKSIQGCGSTSVCYGCLVLYCCCILRSEFNIQVERDLRHYHIHVNETSLALLKSIWRLWN